MAAGVVRFGEFRFDPDNRRLCRGEEPIPLNARYLDALVLLVRAPGDLVTKQRFHDEVWRGVPVTDEALTQCIRTLRRELNDDAVRPHFIETVPKHGYRFIAAVQPAEIATPGSVADAPEGDDDRDATSTPIAILVATAAVGTCGAVAAGLVGGTIYGALIVSRVPTENSGTVSTLLVIVCLTAAIALLGGIGVSLGIALAGTIGKDPRALYMLGGALGGFLTGALVRLVGLDAFNLLLGGAPREITGGGEGALLGAAAGATVWLARSGASLWRTAASGALAGALAASIIASLGGRLLGGSLASLAERFPASRLDLGGLGTLFGESGFGPVTRAVTGAGEAALFVASTAAALVWAQRRGRASVSPKGPPPAP